MNQSGEFTMLSNGINMDAFGIDLQQRNFACPDMPMVNEIIFCFFHFSKIDQFGAASNFISPATSTISAPNSYQIPNNIGTIEQLLGSGIFIDPRLQSNLALLSMWRKSVNGSDDDGTSSDMFCPNRLKKGKMLPPDYVCHLCDKKGHFIKDCPLVR